MLRTLQAADIAGSRALAVPARDEEARNFYLKFDFIPSPADPVHLFVLLKDVRREDGEGLILHGEGTVELRSMDPLESGFAGRIAGPTLADWYRAVLQADFFDINHREKFRARMVPLL